MINPYLPANHQDAGSEKPDNEYYDYDPLNNVFLDED